MQDARGRCALGFHLQFCILHFAFCITSQPPMPVLTNIGLLASCRDEGGQDAIHPITHAALAWRGTDIAWVGPGEAVPDEYRDDERIGAEGRLVVPGLIDCHTHLAFAGWRADEIERTHRA